jgi:hypothetical protein
MRRALPILVAVGAAAWLAVRELHFAGWMDDDAFISFRYARNLVRGAGLVFNPGERVEGYTNFLWTVLLAGLHGLGADLPRAARVLGVLASFAMQPILPFLVRATAPRGRAEDAASPWLAVVPVVLLSTSESWAAAASILR